MMQNSSRLMHDPFPTNRQSLRSKDAPQVMATLPSMLQMVDGPGDNLQSPMLQMVDGPGDNLQSP
eukprot:c35568_g1_i1 orf=205-399(+)